MYAKECYVMWYYSDSRGSKFIPKVILFIFFETFYHNLKNTHLLLFSKNIFT